MASLIVFLILLILLYVIVEPEKIKPIAFILSFMIVGSACALMGYNYWQIGHRSILPQEKQEIPNFTVGNFKHMGLLIGISLFSFESINLIVNGKTFFSLLLLTLCS